MNKSGAQNVCATNIGKNSTTTDNSRMVTRPTVAIVVASNLRIIIASGGPYNEFGAMEFTVA
jgi:hypothetical protein